MYHEVHGSGEPLVLLHGGVGAIEMFGGVLPLLAEERRVVAVDLRGHWLAARIVKLAEATRVVATVYLVGRRHRDG
jgi:pimeloyl-ACP methyl ester carboxylesterase